MLATKVTSHSRSIGCFLPSVQFLSRLIPLVTCSVKRVTLHVLDYAKFYVFIREVGLYYGTSVR